MRQMVPGERHAGSRAPRRPASRRCGRRRAMVALACLAAALAAAPSPADAAGAAGVAVSAPVRVTVSLPPQAYFVERIGGADVRVQVMVPAGTEEETYAPNPRQIADLLHSQLYVAVGHPALALEARYLLPLLRSHPEVRVESMARGVRFIPMQGDAEAPAAGPEREEATDPHIWLAPAPVTIAARNIAGALAAVDPGRRAAYGRGLEGFERDLRALDAAFRRAAAGPRPVRFLSYHPAWGYLARQYGFQQLVVEAGGKDPGTASLLRLVAAARRLGVRLVLVPPGFPSRTTEALASSIGGRVLVLDYMARDWLAMMSRLAAALAEVGRGA
jgi:zinc transport system substrate-binding protein